MSTVFITGGHSGLGLEAAKNLAAMGLNLVLAGRNVQSIEPAAAQLRSAHGVQVTAIKLDLSSLASVRSAVAACNAKIASGEIDALQAIVCNAGANFLGKVSYSVDGYENTFATNYLGHFLLVQLLLDHVAKNGRIVFVASGTHDPDTRDGKFAGIAAEADAFALANLGKDGSKPISGGQRYSTSKLCMILCAYELDRRLKRSGKSIASIAYDPGSMPETGLMRSLPGPLQALTKSAFTRWVTRMIGITLGTLAFSGASLAKVTADPSYAQMSGKYLQSNDGSLLVAKSSKASYNEASAVKLWDDSKRLAHLLPTEEPATLQ
jgi:NAD(P)-dependent dehydrogenase (short-subunit alcohol dehydrogenase family)